MPSPSEFCQFCNAQDLAVSAIGEQFCQLMQKPQAQIIVKAPTGTGKSSYLPALALSRLEPHEKILVVQPRRLAARMLAERVAFLLEGHPQLHGSVGYITRYEKHVNATTRLLFVTDGILQRLLLEDPLLGEYRMVVFDEFHERRLASDLALSLCVKAQQQRAQLILTVMSATLDAEQLTEWLGQSDFLFSSTPAYPVEISYLPPKTSAGKAPEPLWEQVVQACRQAAAQPLCSEILVFLPGKYEINRTRQLLENSALSQRFRILALHSALDGAEQREVLRAHGKPRIILATNIAETSLTIAGINCVIDSGLARSEQFDQRRGFNSLLLKKISRASAEQRCGRAGRTGPGLCIRLWSQRQQQQLEAYEQAEIERVDLSPAMLWLGNFGAAVDQAQNWPPSPPPAALEYAKKRLLGLQAFDQQMQLSPIGRRMLQLSCHPLSARLLLAGQDHDCLQECIFAAAMLESESLWAGIKPERDDFAQGDDYCDLQADWRAFTLAKHTHFDLSRLAPYKIHAANAKKIEQLLRQLRAQSKAASQPCDFAGKKAQFIAALLEVMPELLVVKTSAASNSVVATQKRRGQLAPSPVAKGHNLFLALSAIEIEGKDVTVYFSQLCRVELGELQTSRHYNCSRQLRWDEITRSVSRRQVESWMDVELSSKEQSGGKVEEAQSALLAEKILELGLHLDGWGHAAEQLIHRINFAHEHLSDWGFSAFGPLDRQLAVNLLCEGAVSYRSVKDRDVLPIIRQWLDANQQRMLDQHVPTQITLANGQNAKVSYNEQLQAKISMTAQRLIGQPRTPTIACGRVSLLVEILAPNQRPWQLTADLQRFWQSGFAQMKKDLAGRYPRHRWEWDPDKD